MKKVLLMIFAVTLLTGCGVFTPEPTAIPTAIPIPTEEPTPLPTVVPEPTSYPERWRRALVEDTHSFYEKTGDFNKAGFPILVPSNIGKAQEGEVYWCDFPIQGDGQKFCKVMVGFFEGYFLRVRKITWLDRE